jgi:hypothetical protein
MFYFCTMQYFKNIFNFYLKASIHVALAIVCLIHLSHQMLNISSDAEWFIFLFLGILCGYNILKYTAFWVKNGFNPSLPQRIFGFTMFLMIFLVYFFLKFTSSLQYKLLFFLLGFLIYPIIRNYAVGKLSFVALTVSCLTVLLPIFYTGEAFEFPFGLFLQQFFLVFALLVPFEIADVTTDALKFPTLPQRMGIHQFKILGYGSIFLYFVLALFQDTPLVLSLFFLGSSILATGMSNPQRSFYFTAFWVEAIPILGWLVYFSFQVLQDFLF